MKILMLTPYLPYPDSSGGQIRTQNLLKHLKKDHDITLFSLIKDPKEKQYIPILERDFCKKVKVFRRSAKAFTVQNILNTGFSAQPFLVVRNFSPDAKKAIETELQEHKYDLIHVETFYAMPHIPTTNVPIVLVDQTIEFKVYEHYVKNTAPFFLKPLMYVDVNKLRYWERYYWRQASRVVAVSEKDAQEMETIEPGLKVDIVPNGVNLDLFKKRSKFGSKSPKILFVGNFTWLQNTEAAEILVKKILPLVQKKIPKATVVIAGQHHPETLLKLQSKSVEIRQLEPDDVAGIVNAYHDTDVFCTPLFGPGGTRLKNLAAMASQLPIVSSTVGMAGLGVEDETHALIDDDPKQLAKDIIEVVTNSKLARSLATKAREYVEQNYDYKVIAKRLSQIYQEVGLRN